MKKPFTRWQGVFLRTYVLMLLLATLIIVFFVTTTIPRERAELLNSIKSHARSVSASLAQVIGNAIVEEDYTYIVENSMQILQVSDDILYVGVVKKDGVTLLHRKDGWTQIDSPPADWDVTLRRKPHGRIQRSTIIKDEVYNYSFPVSYSGVDWGWIDVGISLESFEEDLRKMYMMVLLVSIVSLLIAAATAYFFARQLTRPILSLSEATEQISRGDLSARASVVSRDELGGLAQSFNKMAQSMSDDIRERQHIEDNLKRALAFQSEILANVSHELRTPLTSIIGFMELTLKEAQTAKTVHFLGKAQKNAQYLLKLISDLLEVSALDAGKIVVAKDRFGLDAIINSCIETTSPLIPVESVSVETQFNTNNMEMISDKLKVETVITNLLSNAIKFTTKGVIRVSVDEIEGRNDWLRINIADQGVGIPKDKLESIFEKFKQIDGSSTRRFGGSGLGLYIVKQHVGVLGGTITVKSQEGKGSAFIVDLPRICPT